MCYEKIVCVFFPNPKFCISPPFPRQLWGVLCRLENGQPITATVYSHCIENFEDMFIKDDFWDGMTNPALDQEDRDQAELLNVSGSAQGSSPGGLVMTALGSGGGARGPEDNNSLPLKKRKSLVLEKQSRSEPANTAGGDTDSLGGGAAPDGHTTVITVKGSGEASSDSPGGGAGGVGQVSPSDRTSLLGANHVSS